MHVNILTAWTKRKIQKKNKTYLEKHSFTFCHIAVLTILVQLLIYSFSSIAVLVCTKGVCEGACLFDGWATHHPFFNHQHEGLLQSVMGFMSSKSTRRGWWYKHLRKTLKKKHNLLAHLGCIYTLPVNSFLLGFPEIRGKHMTAGLVRRHTDVCAKEWGRGKILSVLLHRLLLQSISQRGRHRDAEWHALVQSCHWSVSCGQWESGSASHWAATPHSSLILIQLQERLPGNRICLWEQSTSRGGNMRHCNGYIKMWETYSVRQTEWT